MRIPFLVSTLIFLAACGHNPNVRVVRQADVEKILGNTDRRSLTEATEQLTYWSSKLTPDSSGIGDVSGLAGANSAMFAVTGDMLYLKAAEALYKKAISNSANNKDGFTRALARNYISQHRFREAKTLLDESKTQAHNKSQTALVDFDICMELGLYEEAGENLNAVANEAEFDYLIRRAKWSDNLGNLDEAIRYMEKAKSFATESNQRGLIIWANTNLADFYGHAGRLEESYELYLATLEMEPDNAYAIKSLAWMAYSNDGNHKLALDLINKAMEYHAAPDHHLLKSEILAANGASEESEVHIEKFIEQTDQPIYGEMYNIYLIELMVDRKPSYAEEIASREVSNRSTPEAYHWLAYTKLKTGQKNEALEIIKNNVAGQTSEPLALYHASLVYRANGLSSDADAIKSELQSASYELGPVLMADINR